MHYKLIITERSEELLDNIINYIINKLKNPQAAKNLIIGIENVYSNLEYNPEIYAYSEDHFMKSRGYRKAVIPNYNKLKMSYCNTLLFPPPNVIISKKWVSTYRQSG
jgi:plasmid stabilization system protein ParE